MQLAQADIDAEEMEAQLQMVQVPLQAISALCISLFLSVYASLCISHATLISHCVCHCVRLTLCAQVLLEARAKELQEHAGPSTHRIV